MKIGAPVINNYSNPNFQTGNSNTSSSAAVNEGMSTPIPSTVTIKQADNTYKSNPEAYSESGGDSFIEFSRKPKDQLNMDEKQWIEVIEKANKAINGAMCNFEYSIHEKTREIMIKVIDKDTKEVLREIPPAKVLDMVAKMWEMAGILVDERR